MNMSGMKPGHYKGVTFEDYLQIKAINSTCLKQMAYSAEHAKLAIGAPESDEKDETPAKSQGTLGHQALLEPATFDSMWEPTTLPQTRRLAWSAMRGATYTLAPANKKDMSPAKKSSTKDGVILLTAEDYMEVKRVCDTGKTPLPADQHSKALGVREAAYRHPLLRSILTEGTDPMAEVTLIWHRDGVPCKARLDYLCRWEGNIPYWPLGGTLSTMKWNGLVCPDVKTTMLRIDSRSGKSLHDIGAHYQQAWYEEGIESVFGEPVLFLFAQIESLQPCGTKVMRLASSAVGEATECNDTRFGDVRTCLETGDWPGYSTDVHVVDIPEYGYSYNEVEPTMGGKAMFDSPTRTV